MQSMSDAEVLSQYLQAKDTLKHAQDYFGRLEQEIISRAKKRGANGIPTEGFECSVTWKNEYDQTLLVPLKEIFSHDDMMQCWEDTHFKTVEVPARFDLRKAQTVARKYGKDALEIIEKARFDGKPSVKVLRK